MITVTSVIATSQVIRLPDGHSEVITEEALAQAADQLNANGGMPFLLDHDWTRPIGWTNRAWIEQNGDHVRLCTVSDVPETRAETDALVTQFATHCAARRLEATSPYAQALVAFADGPVELAHDLCCVYLAGAGLVDRVLPDVIKSTDDDGLIPIASSEIVGGAWVKRGSYLLSPSRFLRPGWSLPNPPNRDFLNALVEVKQRNPHLSIKLAIDFDLIGIPESLQEHEQRDYWWGPPYNGNPINQPHGVTVHGPTKYDAASGLRQTEFWWYGKEERTLQVEEVFDQPRWRSYGNERRTPARFVHSIFNPATGSPDHLDGAVRLYTDAEWSDRIGLPVDKFGKRGIRHKLWVVDGEMQLSDWYTLIHMFFKGNFTIAEYFGLGGPTRN